MRQALICHPVSFVWSNETRYGVNFVLTNRNPLIFQDIPCHLTFGL